MTLTRRGVAAALLGTALLATGWFWRYPGVAGLGAAFVALTGLGLVSVLRRAPVGVHRTVWPLEVTRYGECTGTVQVRRTGGLLPVHLHAVEQVAGVAVPVRIPRLGPGEVTEVSYPIPTDRRGVLAVGPLRAYRWGVAGTAERHTPLGGTVAVRVLPRVLPVRGLPSGVRRGHTGTDERVERGGTDLVGLREYTAGDDLRRLHWATSARTGTLMVREDADPSRAHLAVLLDDRAASYPGGDLEDAVEVAASLVVAAVEGHHGVRLLTVCDQLDLAVTESDRTDPGGRGLAARLAEVTARTVPAQPRLPAAARDIVVVVTGSAADPGPLLLGAGQAAVGVLAVVDRSTTGTAAAAGTVTVLRGRTADDLLRLWDRAVVG